LNVGAKLLNKGIVQWRRLCYRVCSWCAVSAVLCQHVTGRGWRPAQAFVLLIPQQSLHSLVRAQRTGWAHNSWQSMKYWRWLLTSLWRLSETFRLSSVASIPVSHWNKFPSFLFPLPHLFPFSGGLFPKSREPGSSFSDVWGWSLSQRQLMDILDLKNTFGSKLESW